MSVSELEIFSGFLASVVVGLSLGSFATLLAWRLPRGIPVAYSSKSKPDQEIVSVDGDKKRVERSRCPACGTRLGWRDLIPLVSWLLQKGRCRYCGARIPVVYPLIELGTAIFCFAAFLSVGWHIALLGLWALAPVLAALVAIDQQHKIIPNKLNAAILLLGMGNICVLAVAEGVDRSGFEAMMWKATMGAVFFGVVSWMIRWVFSRVFRREAMGMGDVKFFVAAGAWLGPFALPWFMALAGLVGAVLGIVPVLLGRGQREIPFGPSLVFSFVVLLLLPDLFPDLLADY